MSSPPSEEEEVGGRGRAAAGNTGGDGGLRMGDPSSSRTRSAEAVWPDHFLEALATRVAADAASAGGRLAAAPAVATVFQVCSTWRSVSQSELLWEEITRHIWHGLNRQPVPPATWHREFVRLHRTGRNLETGRYVYSSDPSVIGRCTCLVLSDAHVAAGFMDGTVRVFRLLPPSPAHVATYSPQPQHACLGVFSVAVTGAALLPTPERPDRVVFASRAGDIHVGAPLGRGRPGRRVEARRSRAGDTMESGTMVDFAGDARWWVGLFAGVPGRSWRVWDAVTEQQVYVGGTLMDGDAVDGWRQLTQFSETVLGRIRMSDRGTVVGCRASSVEVMDLEGDMGSIVTGAYELLVRRRGGANVHMMDACEGKVMLVDGRGSARICRTTDLGELCRFSTRVGRRRQHQQEEQSGGCGCMNWEYAFVWGGGGEVGVWNARRGGQSLYSLEAQVGEREVLLRALAANWRYVAAWCEDSGLHVWDFVADV